MARKLNHENPYRDPDPTRADVSREPAWRFSRPAPERITKYEIKLSGRRSELKIMSAEVKRRTALVERAIDTWIDNKRRRISPASFCENQVAELLDFQIRMAAFLEDAAALSSREDIDSSGCQPDLMRLHWRFQDLCTEHDAR